MSDHEDYDGYDYDYDYDQDDGYAEAEAVVIPEKVKAFLLHFQRCLREGNMREINGLYENTFISLTDAYFTASPWPDVNVVSDLVSGDKVFLLFYREIYYRHIYANLQPTLQQRFDSYQAYCDLFGYLLGAATINDVPAGVLQIPPAWVWDIVDEFIYQFQSFCQFRHKARGEDERAAMAANPDMWSVKQVLRVLHGLIGKSNIQNVLDRERGDLNLVILPSEPGYEFGAVLLYKMLGYFSLIGLLRLNVLLGDFHSALAVLDPIDILDKKGYYTLVTACHMSLFYYLGVAYLMLRRYVDAVNSWSNALVYITRTKQFHTRSYQYNQIEKMNEQMYLLLAVTHSLCPQRLDEALQAKLSKEHADRLQRMQRGEIAAFEEAFLRACPKFITPSAPRAPSAAAAAAAAATASAAAVAAAASTAGAAGAAAAGAVPADEIAKHGPNFVNQFQLFVREVRQALIVPKLRSYLKLYTSISVAKLASFFSLSDAECRVALAHYKHKTRNLVWDEEDALLSRRGPISGRLVSMSDVEFYVDGDMVHIADTKVARRYGEYFMQHIVRFEAMMVGRKA